MSDIGGVSSNRLLDDTEMLFWIICFLNSGREDKNSELTQEEKIKFSFLCSRNLCHKLEDIYIAYPQMKDSIDFLIISIQLNEFFRCVLKFHNIFGYEQGAISTKESDAAAFNIWWLQAYDRSEFFEFVDGQSTLVRRYEDKKLTLDIADNIVGLLEVRGIPLTNIIVSEAFRMYFAGNLDDYLGRVEGYAMEFAQYQSQRVK